MVSKSQRKRPRPENTQLPPRVVVKFRDYVQLPYAPRAEKAIAEQRLGPMEELTERFPGLTVAPLFTSKKESEIRELVDRARKTDPTYELPNLLTWFAVELPFEAAAREVAELLGQWRNVELAYVDPGPVEPPVPMPADDPRNVNQGYLDPAPDGIDARFAWAVPGADGQGQALVDMEWGWTLNHEDLNAHGIGLISGLNHSYFFHGTAVLGEVAAVDNALGCIGITPELASIRVVGQWRAGGGYSTVDAILDSVAVMDFGDVLLLEAQTSVFGYSKVPVETEPAVFDVVRLATALGIVVVEAAGNGGVDLDTVQDGGGEFVLNRTSPDFRDSGAIVVGAGSAAAPHTRLGFSCYGSRVDCYGWGQSVDTCTTDGSGTATDQYTTGFSGTSSASPIVTGAALAVQGMAEVNLGYRFSPWQLREILNDPANGTASANPVADRIGVMPDLRQIITNDLGLVPDVYVRDNVADAGDPHAGPISASPDVIARPAPVADPQASFGEGSGTENDAGLGFVVEAGQDNVIYVRVRNRAGVAAADVDATVYWSEVATLVTPDLWNPVGTVTLPNVPAGDVLTVSDPLTWAEADIPATGHYCFVALVGNDQDPAPAPADFLDWDNFRTFIRNNNNVTWRNFNVEDNLPDPPSAPTPPGFKSLSFLAPGAPDRARPFTLEVLGRLPREARLAVELPGSLADAFRLRGPHCEESGERAALRVPLKPAGVHRLGKALFPAGSRHRLRLLVAIPKELRQRTYQVAVRQLYQGEEVGRVTWRLGPPRQHEGDDDGGQDRRKGRRKRNK